MDEIGTARYTITEKKLIIRCNNSIRLNESKVKNVTIYMEMMIITFKRSNNYDDITREIQTK